MAVGSPMSRSAREPRVLRAQPVDRNSFARYGELIEPPLEAVRLNHVAAFADDRPRASVNAAVVRSGVAHLPLVVGEMERHPHSNQIFVPLDARRYLIVVAVNGADGRPDPGSLAAFTVCHPNGINYHPETWHINMTCLDEQGSFFLMMNEDGSSEDCIFAVIDKIAVEIDVHIQSKNIYQGSKAS